MLPIPGILVIQHVAPEPASRIAAVASAAGIDLHLIRVYAGEPVPTSIGQYTGLVVMGGPMGAYEIDRYPHLRDERRLIESALEKHVPILGVCLGSQLLAAALGATVRPGPRKEIGWLPLVVEPAAKDDPLFAAVPRSFTALHWHGDVFDLPPGAVALARSELTSCQAFRHGFAYGLLFHLEVTSKQLTDMTIAFGDELVEAGLSPRELLSGWLAHGTMVEAVGEMVFSLWMDLVRSYQHRPTA
jgi:GMP synthase (glutamine-hydrolysing)